MAVGEGAGAGGGYVVVEEQLLGKSSLRSRFWRRIGMGRRRRSPRRSAGRLSLGRGVFRAYDDEADLMLIGSSADGIEVGCLDREIAGDCGDTGVAGGDEEIVQTRRLADLPGDGVLAGAGTDDEDVHGRLMGRAGGCSRVSCGKKKYTGVAAWCHRREGERVGAGSLENLEADEEQADRGCGDPCYPADEQFEPPLLRFHLRRSVREGLL